MYTPIQSSRLYLQIVEQIEQRILRGELRAGDRLPTERELAEQFGVSRTAVREAMKALAQQGLIEVRPGRGTYVIDGTSRAVRTSLGHLMRMGQAGDLAQLVEAREILEPELAALAAERAGAEDIAAMQQAVHLMDQHLNDASAFIAADNAFHRALAEATGNTIILALIDSIVDLLTEQRTLIFAIGGGPERGQYHHKRILEAIRRHDAHAARAAMGAHLRQVREDSGLANDLPAA